MTTYDFDTITADQAHAIQPDDILLFTGHTATDVSVIFAPSPGPDRFAPVTIAIGGHAVEFSANLAGVSANGGLRLPDSSKLLVGSRLDDALVGGPGNDAVFGGTGDDRLDAGDGRNLLQGNIGNDTLTAGVGADTILGGQGDDRIRTGTDAAPADELGDFANGNLGDDTIQGGGGGDVLLGGQGNDSIVGGSGFDLLNGNLGDDYLVGDGVQPDQLFGEAGDDTLVAGGGADVLSGGAGQDLFVIAPGPVAAKAGLSSITDWEAQDHIHFAGLGATTPGYVEILNVTNPTFDGARASAESLFASGSAGIVAVAVGTDVVVFADTTPGGGAEAAVVLVGRTLADIDAHSFI